MGSTENIVVASYVEDVYSVMVHGVPLRDDNYRVAVEVAFIEGTPLLIPNEDIGATLVVYVIGSFVA